VRMSKFLCMCLCACVCADICEHVEVSERVLYTDQLAKAAKCCARGRRRSVSRGLFRDKCVARAISADLQTGVTALTQMCAVTDSFV